jgi:hypothetical protein
MAALRMMEAAGSDTLQDPMNQILLRVNPSKSNLIQLGFCSPWRPPAR